VKKLVFLCLFFFSLIVQSYGQQPWSLEACIQQAVQKNIQVRQNMLNVESAQSRYNQSQFNMLPSVNGFASHGYNWGQRIDPFTNTFATSQVQTNNFSLNAQVTLFNGLQQYNNLRASRLSTMAAREDVEAIKNDISMMVASTYLTVLFNRELLTNAQNQVDISQQQVDRISKLVEAGQLARGSLLDLEAQLASDELSVVNAENRLSISMLSLSQLMMLTPEEYASFSIVVPELGGLEVAAMGISANDVYQTALGQMPQVKASELRIESASRSLSVAQGGYSPTLSAGVSTGTGYSGASREAFGDPAFSVDTFGFTSIDNESVLIPSVSYDSRIKPFGDQLRDNINTNLNFSLSIPIFNGMSVRNNVQQARIGQETARLGLETVHNQLRVDVYQSHADALAAMKRFKAAEKAMSAMEENFRYAEVRYEEGFTNSVEYNDVKTRMANARSEMIQAKYDYLFKLKVLDFYQGKPLGF